MKKQILAIAVLFALLVGGSALVSAQGGKPETQGQSTTHQVFCQKTGDGWKIVKGDDPSDNQNRVQVGTWDEHERGEKWNQKKASDEFLGKCPKPVEETCPAPGVVIKERCVTPQPCPEGTTLIDYKDEYRQEPICKGNPTGCPYGDSIPVDSPKCAPADEVENTTPEYVPTPDGGMKNVETGEVFYGK